MLRNTVLVELQKRKLTDGSYVLEVELWNHPRWNCVDETAAFALQQAIVDAARKYANNDTVSGFSEVSE